MFAKEYLDATKERLSKFGSQKKTDPKFKYYEQAIGIVFNSFLEEVKRQPPVNQLKFIAGGDLPKRMVEKNQDINLLKSFLFIAATTATLRLQKLPENHPEKEPINKLFHALSEAWVTGFTGTFNIPKLDLLSTIQNELCNWLNAYDNDANPEANRETLLTFYSIACFFESQLSAYKMIIPTEKINAVAEMKAKIEKKFSEALQKEQIQKKEKETLPVDQQSPVDELPTVSSALQQLSPPKVALATVPEYEQFKSSLEQIKTKEAEKEAQKKAEIQEKINSFDSEKHGRLEVLGDILNDSEVEDPMIAFWEKYNTHELFDQLMKDLEIKEPHKSQWNTYFETQHGTGVAYITSNVSTFFSSIWQNETRSHKFSIELLTEHEKIFAPLQASSEKIKEYKEIINLNIETPQSQLIKEIENEFKKLEPVEKINIQTLIEQQKQIKTTKDQEEIDFLTQVNQDIEVFQKHISKQMELVTHLANIHKKIMDLNKHGVSTDDLSKSFQSILKQVISTVAQGDKIVDPLTPIEDNIEDLRKEIEQSQKEIEQIKNDIKKLASDVNTINTKVVPSESIKNNSIVGIARDFITNHKDKFWHKVLCFFSSSYEKLFNKLENAVENENSDEIKNIISQKTNTYVDTHAAKAWLFSEVKELQKLEKSPEPEKIMEETQTSQNLGNSCSLLCNRSLVLLSIN